MAKRRMLPSPRRPSREPDGFALHPVDLVPDLLVHDDTTGARTALDALTRELGSPRSVVAFLVEAHGWKVLQLLVYHKSAPAIRAWLAYLQLTEQYLAVDRIADVDVYRRALDLAQAGGIPRRALARLIEYYGLRGILQLAEHWEEPTVASLLGLSSRRRPGRPVGSHSRDAVAYALATAVSDLGIKPVKLLRALGRDDSSGSPDHPWLNLCRKRGDALRANAESPDSAIPLLAFWRAYFSDNPKALLAALIPYFAEASGPKVDTATLHKSLESLLKA